MFTPAPHANPMGGLGNFSDEMLESASSQSASPSQANQASQAAMLQQLAAAQGGGGADTPISPDGLANLPGVPGNDAASKHARDVGSLSEELVTRPVQDIKDGLASILDFDAFREMLGFPANQVTPEKKAELQRVWQGYQSQDGAHQQAIQQKFQLRQQQAMQQRQEDEMKRQQKAAQEAQTISVPSGPKKGPVGPSGNSSRQRAETKLENDRKTMKNPSGAN